MKLLDYMRKSGNALGAVFNAVFLWAVLFVISCCLYTKHTWGTVSLPQLIFFAQSGTADGIEQRLIFEIVGYCLALPINSLEFFINSFNFCRGKRGVFLCTATECRRGWQRKATGCQGLWRRVSEAAGSCGEPCADGPGLREAVCGRAAGASVRTGRGANRFSAWR